VLDGMRDDCRYQSRTIEAHESFLDDLEVLRTSLACRAEHLKPSHLRFIN
jgi:hypothetical protein